MTRPTFVYFVATQARDRVKIGCSYIPASRLSNLTAWSPYPLDLIASAPGTMDDERAVHAAFVQHHSHREWFIGHPDIFAAAEEITKTGELPPRLRGSAGQKNPLSKFAVRKPRSAEANEKVRQANKQRWEGIRASKALWAEIDSLVGADMSLADAFEREVGVKFLHQHWRPPHPYFVKYYGERARIFLNVHQPAQQAAA